LRGISLSELTFSLSMQFGYQMEKRIGSGIMEWGWGMDGWKLSICDATEKQKSKPSQVETSP
jgi:hypothetical protein